jgi:RimJ/RimL family protein N-acetyltransferase
MRSRIVERIETQTGLPGLFTALAERLAPSDLQSLLLGTYKLRAARTACKDLLRRFETHRALAVSPIDPRLMAEFDRAAYEAADGFEAVDLSPVAPLGLNRVLGGIDQDNVLTTVRNTELLGDPTTALALVCAARRRPHEARRGVLRVCASHRVTRLQPFDHPGFTVHFRLFALVSSGRGLGLDELREHARFYLRLFRLLGGCGFSFRKPLVEFSDLRLTEQALAERGVRPEEVRESVRAHLVGGSERFLAERGIALEDRPMEGMPEFPEAEFRFSLSRLEGLGYYRGPCLRISPMAPDGARHPIVDGGVTDWTGRLLEDRKECCVTTGIGTEFACRAYRAAPGSAVRGLVTLRPLAECDLDAVHRLCSDWTVVRYMRLPLMDRPGAEEFVRDSIQEKEGSVVRAVVREGRVVGLGGIVKRPATGDGELWYLLEPASWGRGYTTDAAAQLLELGLGELGLHRVWATVVPENPASMRVLEKIGMRREGYLRSNEQLQGEWKDTWLFAAVAGDPGR